VVEKIAGSQIKFIPDNLVIGGGGTQGGGLMEGFFGIGLLEKLTGRSFGTHKPVEAALEAPKSLETLLAESARPETIAKG
jgi:hypothetical protein